MKVYRYNPTTQQDEVIFNIMEGTYTGKDMGERSITATIEFPSRIDFQIGDYVKIDIANLLRTDSVYGGHGEEKFYIYTMPTVKKIAKRLSHGKAFQHTVTFYPCQYELAAIKMRDLVQEEANGIIYTGYDEFSFYGGANTLMKRIMAVLNERFGTTGVAGVDYWTYFIADAINEDKNTALEKFQFDFSDNSVMDALLKLNEAEGINTKFFINGRTIYVGYKRPYITGVDSDNVMRDIPFEFMYGKTSHLPESTNHGNLFTLTKSNGQASPITRLYAYGSDRNLHRFYCSDRIKSGRYVNKLMLPSFEDDGRTDYIDSEEGIARFGIREGSKTFDKIYPSLRNFYYGNIRDIKYCIKLMGSGLEGDAEGAYDGGKTYVKSQVADEELKNIQSQIDSNNAEVTFIYQGSETKFTLAQAKTLMEKGKVVIYKVGSSQTTTAPYQYPVARVQCYRVVELMNGNTHTGLNTLVECAPPVDLAVFCHATGKVVKCVLYSDDGEPSTTPGMTRAEERQYEVDGQIPVDDEGNYIVGSCFAVHDSGFQCGHTHLHLSHPDYPYYCDDRRSWFINQDEIDIYTSGSVDANKEKYRNQVSIHQINYTDDHWITDVYEFTSYNQQSFNRQGYSAYCWPRINKYYPESQSDNVEVSAVVDVGPVYIEDTDLNRSEGQAQATFDIYLRDVGFKINEQTWFGDKVFLFDTVHINFLDGNLAGYSFEMPGESDQASLGDIYVPALLPDGSRNEEFFTMADSPEQAEQAYLKGAYWRIVAKRCDTEVDNYWMPNINVNAKAGDHVVFLDIFMPDIYIRVAEQRLLKEAQKYLDANDDGDIQYSFDFDKVRLNDQPVFALQMREGAIMRVVDDDLDVGMVNQQKTVFEDKDGLVSAKSMIKTDVTVVTDYDVVNRDADELMEDHVEGYKMTYDSANDVYVLEFDTLLRDADKDLFIDDGITLFYRTGDESYPYVYFTSNPDNIVSVEHIGSGETVARHRVKFKSIKFLGNAQTFWGDGDFWHVQYSFKVPSVTPQTNQYVMPIGQQVFCPANNLTDFKGGKYYEIIMDALESDMTVLDSNGVLRLFALVNGLGEGETFFRPDYTLTDITTQPGATYKRYKISFTLDESFNDVIPYYPAFLYESDGETEAVHVRLWSILERDDEALEDLNYVDLAIDTVTIKFHDNTREAGVSLQDGQEPERLIDHVTEMTREITATVKEESRASAWAQLMNRVADTEIVESQTLDFYETLVNASRRYYNELMALKGSLFDPDGTCNEVFLQIMMLQVGVDSMNYQLKYTHYSITGQRTNCGVIAGSDPSTEHFDAFYIGDADEVLDHFAFTQNPTGGAGGRWYPQKPSDHFILGDVDDDNNPIFPTYFVALKAHKANPNYCYWVCETTQHMVNEDENYFYFNWGILVAGDDGHYALTETRGNAYMYGDNLICGKISTLARDSYFDLTQGNFVLSKNGTPALKYENGQLIIYGVNDDAVTSMLSRLGLTETIANNAALAAATAQQTVNNVINDGIITKGTEKADLKKEWQEIAGDNMFGNTNGSYKKALDQATLYGITSGTERTNLASAYNSLENAMKVIIGFSGYWGGNLGIDTYLKNNDGTEPTRPSGTNYLPMKRDEFSALWRAYYDAEMALWNAIEKACADAAAEQFTNLWPVDEEINLTLQDGETHFLGFILADQFNWGDNFSGSIEVENYSPSDPPDTGYVYISLRVKYIAGGTEYTFWYDEGGGEFAIIRENGKYTFSINTNSIKADIENEEEVPVSKITEIMVYIEPEMSNSASVSLTLCKGIIVSGNKVGVYSLSYKHLDEAMHGSTQIAGGLLMTNLLMLKDEQGKVNAGMSGKTDDSTTPGSECEGVTLWSGGSYEDALRNAMGLAGLTKELLPILLTKTGSKSRIGCFVVEDENSVYIENSTKTEKIKLDIDSGITISKKVNDVYVDKIRIHGGTISSSQVSTNSFTSGDVSISDIWYNSPFQKNPPGFNSDFVLDTNYSMYSVINSITSVKYSVANQVYVPSGVTQVMSWRILGISVGLYNVNTGRFYEFAYSNGVQSASVITTPQEFSMTLKTMSSQIPSGTYKIMVKCQSATGWYRANYEGQSYNMLTQKCDPYIAKVSIVGGMVFSSQLSGTVTEIASNGIMIKGQGGVAQILNDDNNNLIAVMSGLPNSATKSGQLYIDNHVLKVN